MRGEGIAGTHRILLQRPLLQGLEIPTDYKYQQQRRQNEAKKRNTFQTKEQIKPQKNLSYMEIGNVPEKEFRVVMKRMVHELGRMTDA